MKEYIDDLINKCVHVAPEIRKIGGGAVLKVSADYRTLIFLLSTPLNLYLCVLDS